MLLLAAAAALGYQSAPERCWHPSAGVGCLQPGPCCSAALLPAAHRARCCRASCESELSTLAAGGGCCPPSTPGCCTTQPSPSWLLISTSGTCLGWIPPASLTWQLLGDCWLRSSRCDAPHVRTYYKHVRTYYKHVRTYVEGMQDSLQALLDPPLNAGVGRLSADAPERQPPACRALLILG